MNRRPLRSSHGQTEEGGITETPFFTVLTATKDRQELLVEAAESLHGQVGAPTYEHLIIDGGSTDGTARAVAALPHTRFHSGPDDGVYDAWNRGLDRARGEVLVLLNDDDLLMPGSLAAVHEQYLDHPSIDGVSGQYSIGQLADPPAEVEPRPAVTRWRPALRSALGINACWWRTDVVRRLGGFDHRYQLSGDRDFLLRAFLLADLDILPIDTHLYHYRRHEDALTHQPRPRRDRANEHAPIARRLLAHGGLSDGQRDEIRRFHAECVTRQLRRSRHDREWWQFTRTLLANSLRQPGWPLARGRSG